MTIHLARLAVVLGLVRGARRPLASVMLLLVVMLSAGFALSSGAASLAQPSWTQLHPATSPPAREQAILANDPATSRLILFGGYNGVVLGDTWTWTGTTWSQLHPTTSPSARCCAALAFDPATSQLIFFAGVASGFSDQNDTWVWTGTTWSQLHPTTSPSTRCCAALAFDPATNQLLLFGGFNGTSELGDTWVWTGTTWSQLGPATSPPSRDSAMLADDPVTSQLVLFGGYNGTNDSGDTWALKLAPTITSGSSAAFRVGTAGTFTVTTTGAPTPSLGATGALPKGVAFVDNHDGTATLGGTPQVGTGGVYSLTVKASNGVSPDASQSFTLTVNQAPAIPSGNSAAFSVGAAGTFTVTTTGAPIPSLTMTGALPNNVNFVDNHDGTATIGGTPLAGTAGTYPLTLTASNGVSPDATQSFTLTVTQATQAPTITSGTSTAFSVGMAGTFTVTTTGAPTPALTATGALPKNVTFVDNHDGTATLSGTPLAGTAGTYPLTVTASNGVSSDATQSFTLTVTQTPTTFPIYLPFVPR